MFQEDQQFLKLPTSVPHDAYKNHQNSSVRCNCSGLGNILTGDEKWVQQKILFEFSSTKILDWKEAFNHCIV